MKHTPGPWKASQRYIQKIDGLHRRVRQIMPARDSDDIQIALMQASESNLDIEFKANANLIASAPEL